MRRGFLITSLLVLVTAGSTQVAGANVFVGQTNLNIHVQEDWVTGMLVGRPECRGNQTIDLYVDGVWVDATTTGPAGDYAFAYTTVPPTTVQTRFAGSKEGVHPNNHDCLPANSRIVDVWKVKTANGPAKSAELLVRSVRALMKGIGKALSS